MLFDLYLLQLLLRLNFFHCFFFFGKALVFGNCEVQAGGFESRPAAKLAGRTLSGSGSCPWRGKFPWACANQSWGRGGGGLESGLHSKGAAGELATCLSHVAFSYISLYIVPITAYGSQLRSFLNSA